MPSTATEDACTLETPAGRWLSRGGFTGLAVLAVTLAIASLSWPFGWDQGVFAWVGDTIVHGGMPSRDAWDVKGPATGLVYAAVELAFGPGAWPIRIFDLALCAATLPFLFGALARLAGRTAALYGILLRMELGRIDREAWAAGFDNVWLGFSFRADVEVARPRRTTGRYTSPGPAWKKGSDLGARGREFFHDVAAHRPRYIVVGPPVVLTPGSLRTTLEASYLAPVVALLRLEYTVDTIIGRSTVLRDGGAGR